MPATRFDSDVAGVGTATFANSEVLYIAWHVLTEGPRVRRPWEGDTEQILGAGYLQLGDDLSAIGDGASDHWDAPIFLNSVAGRWLCVPSSLSGVFMPVTATRIRWFLSPSTSIHLHVFG